MKASLQIRGFDNLDQAILEELQANGRVSVADLARKIHLSQPAVHNRIKRLEREGIIQQYVALLDHEQIGYDMLAFIQLTLSQHDRTLSKALLNLIENQVRVLECHQLTGEADLLLKVVAENRRALAEVVTKLSECEDVQRVQTSLVLDSHKSTTQLSLD
ncbi:MAG: Lrp/AsnC family transcriptional regulator [Anaerolineae bacterium]|nr:Lrp/AsnC family transcriptional regulator [Anaerolineae bacterium]MCA9893638.1 Lrp/AsnC family transcriptional regulator [Anaerolineae bacterium]MCB9459063.1 Lrp/AsnC family transcriptional regulator [Anaerolineaceae bacterium]